MSGFPGEILEVLHLRVVRDVAVSREFYVRVLGATVLRETPGVLAFLDLAGARLVLSGAGGPTADKPTIAFVPAADPDTVSAELTTRYCTDDRNHRLHRQHRAPAHPAPGRR